MWVVFPPGARTNQVLSTATISQLFVLEPAPETSMTLPVHSKHLYETRIERINRSFCKIIPIFTPRHLFQFLGTKDLCGLILKEEGLFSSNEAKNRVLHRLTIILTVQQIFWVIVPCCFALFYSNE